MFENNNDNKSKLNKRRIEENCIIGAVLIIIGFAVFFAFYTISKFYLSKSMFTSISGENSSALASINEAILKVKSKYVEDVDLDTLVKGAISGITSSVNDPYTRFVSKEEYEEMLVSGTEKYSGIGVHISYDTTTGGIVVLSVMPGSPAQSEGIESGDIILKVGDVTANKDTYYECVDGIKGEENSKVSLTILRNSETFTKEYTRKSITVNNVEYKILDNNIGYIKILSFENDIANQFLNAYNELKSKNIKSLVLDLRNNPGGLVSETIKIAQNLLPAGDIVKLVYKDGTEKKYICDGKKAINIPLAVLVNEHSASASEILSGAIKDLKAGTIIGTKTYGKGIVQSVEKLDSDLGALSITTSKYYTASGKVIHGNGIEPDISVELDEEYKKKSYVPYEKDYQLQKAIQVLTSSN